MPDFYWNIILWSSLEIKEGQDMSLCVNSSEVVIFMFYKIASHTGIVYYSLRYIHCP